MSLWWILIIFVVIVILFIVLSRVNWDEVATNAAKNYAEARVNQERLRNDIEAARPIVVNVPAAPRPHRVIYQEFKEPTVEPSAPRVAFDNIIEVQGSLSESSFEESSASLDYSFIEPSMLSENSDRSLVLAPGNYVRSFTDVEERDSHGETKCRQVLEKMIGKTFPKQRPKFLVNPKTGANLELDCYNAELKLAVEYNGEQHYKFLKFFHKTEADFKEQQYRDDVKKQICRNKGITLITVPYTVRLDDIPQYIEDRIPKSMFTRAVSC